MGSGQSKTSERRIEPDYGAANVRFMKINYGKESVAQLDLWVNECCFPQSGSLSVKQLEALEVRLTDLEKRGLVGKFGGKIKFEADWSAFNNWMKEAKHRQGPKGLPAQCPKLDSDLNSAPPARPPPYADHRGGEEAGGSSATNNSSAAAADMKPTSPSADTSHGTPRGNVSPHPNPSIPSSLRSGKSYGPEQGEREGQKTELSAPMLEVAAGNGEAQLVYRPWLMSDMIEAMATLPHILEGGEKYGEQLHRPTIGELRRMLTCHMSNDWHKVADVFMDNESARLVHCDYEHDTNAAYRAIVNRLMLKLKTKFPVCLDWGKVVAVKQGAEESVPAYLFRLREAAMKYGGLTETEVEAKEGERHATQMRLLFLNGVKPEIADVIHRVFLTWPTADLADIERHAVGAEAEFQCQRAELQRQREEEAAKKLEKKDRLSAKLLLAQLQDLKGGRKGKSRGGRRDKDKDKDRCYNCGKSGHWARNCHKGDNNKKKDGASESD
ncbi:uncharacterized protein LOC144462602 [Epinephelus lanceolatus]